MIDFRMTRVFKIWEVYCNVAFWTFSGASSCFCTKQTPRTRPTWTMDFYSSVLHLHLETWVSRDGMIQNRLKISEFFRHVRCGGNDVTT
jgi:hypothetical protein